MLRISSLIRNARNLTKIPIRGGPPGWSRPDVPPSAVVEPDHELSDDEIIFFFPDRNMPEFFLTQPQIYEGDSIMDNLQNVFKSWGFYLLTASLIGGIAYFMVPLKNGEFISSDIVELAKKDEELVESKQLLTWAQQNPMGIAINADFPTVLSLEKNKMIQRQLKAYQQDTKPNGEVQDYLTKLRAQCAQKLKKADEPSAE